ncbi:MAG: hypothetical protein AAF602_09860 [Myxococcota bacterium]
MWWMAWTALAAPPTVPEGSVLRPDVRVDDTGYRSGGTAFVVEHDDAIVYLTALHLAGPALGFARQYTADEVPYTVGLQLRDWQTSGLVDVTTEGRRLLGAADDGVLWGDMMAFDTSSRAKKNRKKRKSKFTLPTPLPLAATCPARGATVFGVGADRVQSGTVIDCRPWELSIRVEPGHDVRATSGGPWLDEAGRVVGMMVAFVDDTALAVPAATLQARLDGVVPASPLTDGELDWPHVPNPWNLDLVGLHEKLLVEWGLSGAQEQTIREALAPIPPLAELFAEISRLAWADSMGNFDALDELGRRWDALYAEQGVPLTHQFAATGGNQLGWMTHAEVGRVSWGRRQAPLVVRVDTLNVAESAVAFGKAGGSQIRPRGVRDDVIAYVLPRFDDLDLIAELRNALPPAALARLSEAAPHYRIVASVRRAMRKRSRCSRVQLPTVAWDGLSDELEEQLEANLGSGRCAGVLQRELDQLRDATRALRALDALDDALGRLVAHAVRPYAAVALSGAARPTSDEAWTRALRDAESRHTARALVCSADRPRRPAACDQPPQTTESLAIAGLPDTLPVEWAGR